jgi:hypothetical protein
MDQEHGDDVEDDDQHHQTIHPGAEDELEDVPAYWVKWGAVLGLYNRQYTHTASIALHTYVFEVISDSQIICRDT